MNAPRLAVNARAWSELEPTSNGVGHMASGGAYTTFASPSDDGSYGLCLGPDGHISGATQLDEHRSMGERAVVRLQPPDSPR